MKKEELIKIFKKCFGKEKDDKYHAIAMLAIYGIFILIIIVGIKIGGNATQNIVANPSTTPSPTPNTNKTESPIDTTTESPSINDINYSYSYTVTYNGISDVYLGKKVDEKEKFTLISNGTTKNYAILNDNYLVLENGTYHLTENPSKFLKYCDIEKILNLVETEAKVEKENTILYTISNKDLSFTYKDKLLLDNEKDNTVKFSLSNNVLKRVDLDLSNYLTSIENKELSLTVTMEFADIGTTADFEIKIS